MDKPDKYAKSLAEAMDSNGIKSVEVAKAARVGSNNVALARRTAPSTRRPRRRDSHVARRTA
jgi:hypothetical protein